MSGFSYSDRAAPGGPPSGVDELPIPHTDLLRAVWEHGREAVLLLGTDGRIHWANPAAHRLFGADPTTPHDAFASPLSHSEDLGQARAWWQAIREGKDPGPLTARAVHLDGSWRMVQSVAARVGDRHVAILLRDVTALSEAQRAADEMSQRLTTVVTLAPIILFALDRHGIVTLSMGRGLDIFGHHSGDLVGMDARLLYPPGTSASDSIDRALAGETHRSVWRQGGFTTETAWSPMRDAAGNPDGVLGVVIDVTEREKALAALATSERRFAEVVRTSPAIMAITRLADSMVVDVNEACCRAFDASRDQLLGHRITDLGVWPDPADRVNAMAPLWTGQAVEGVSIRVRSLLGAERDIVFYAVATEIDGEPYVLNSGIDVTDLRRTETELRSAGDELARVSRERQELLEGIVGAQEQDRRRIAAELHDDVLQMMAGVNLQLERVRTRLDGGESDRLLAEAQASLAAGIQRCRNFVFALRPAALDRDGLGAALTAALENIGNETGVEHRLVGHLSADPPAAAGTHIFRIVQEALVNARKHAGASLIELAVDDADDLVLAVRDNGCGFDLAAERRADSLGLVTMRERAQLLGGDVTVTSSPGAGTVVRLEVPRTW